MLSTKKNKPVQSTPFSDFIRSAPAGTKKKVFTEVLKKASEDQKETVAEGSRKR